MTKSKAPEKRGGMDRRVKPKTGTLPWAGSPRNLPESPADYQLHKSLFHTCQKSHLDPTKTGSIKSMSF